MTTAVEISIYIDRVKELGKMGLPVRIAQTRAAAESAREAVVKPSAWLETLRRPDVFDAKSTDEIDPEFFVRLLEAVGVEGAISFRDIETQIRDALEPKDGKAKEAEKGMWVKEMFDGFAIVEDPKGQLLRVEYIIDEEEKVKIGKKTPVEVQYVESQLRRGKSRVQSLLFPKTKFTMSEAKKWAKDHDFSVKKGVTEGNFRRLRILSPSQCAAMRTVTFGKGIKAILCISKS